MKDGAPTWVYGSSLPAELYNSDAVFRDDLDWLVNSQWLMTGHVSRIPKAGDFFLYEIDKKASF